MEKFFLKVLHEDEKMKKESLDLLKGGQRGNDCYGNCGCNGNCNDDKVVE